MRYILLCPSTPDQLDRARAAFAAVAQGPTAEHAVAGLSGRSVHVLLETPNSPAVAPRTPVYTDEREIVFYDGLPVHPRFDAFDARTLAANWHDAADTTGSFTLVRLDKQTGTLELRLDAIGSCPVYQPQLGGAAWAYTNVARLAHHLAVPGDLDPLGVAGLLCNEALLGDRTLVTTVRALPGESWVTANATPPPLPPPPTHTTHPTKTDPIALSCRLQPSRAS